MIILDDVISVRHLISCTDCGIFTNMNDWLTHKAETKHTKDCHSVAICGGTRVDMKDEFEIVHSFDRI